jgi:iron complex transport system substrate-binding protein
MGIKKVWGKSASVTAAAILALSLALAGCGSKSSDNEVKQPAVATVQPSAPAASNGAHEGHTDHVKTTYPLKLKDATGTEVTFEKAPERIVTLVPSETETVFALGAGDKVVGVDKWSDYPEEAKSKPQVGDMNTNIEAVAAAKPDVVFASSSMNKKAIEALRGLGIKVYASNPKTIAEAIERVELFGQILDMHEQGMKTADEMRADLKKVTDAVKDAPKKRVYLEFNIGWTVGDGEFLSEMVELSGGTNVAAGKPSWYEIDPETIIKANPEVVIYSKGEAGMESILDAIKGRPGFDKIDALKNNKLYGIDGNLTSRVGPRVTKGLVEIAKAIHPELIK